MVRGKTVTEGNRKSSNALCVGNMCCVAPKRKEDLNHEKEKNNKNLIFLVFVTVTAPILNCFTFPVGLRVARCWWRSWLRHCATSRKVAGSIPDVITGIFH
jgi:hypothetical protein